MAPKSVQELLETANSGNYFSFTVVRHPFDRLVSAYRDRILHGCTDQAKYHIPQIFSLTRRRLILLGRENQVMEFLGFINLVKINLMKLFSNIPHSTFDQTTQPRDDEYWELFKGMKIFQNSS